MRYPPTLLAVLPLFAFAGAAHARSNYPGWISSPFTNIQVSTTA